MGNSLPRVLVVEDEVRVARAIARTLRVHADIVEAVSSREAMTVIEHERPFTIVADVHLKDGSGFDVISEARRRGAGEAALLISGDQSLVNLAYERKIPFLLKPFESRLLVHFFADAARKQRARESSVVDTLGDWTLKYGLTPAETDVFEAALSGGARKELAVALGKSDETVKTHIHNLLDKTGHDSVRAVVAALLHDAMESLKD